MISSIQLTMRARGEGVKTQLILLRVNYTASRLFIALARKEYWVV